MSGPYRHRLDDFPGVPKDESEIVALDLDVMEPKFRRWFVEALTGRLPDKPRARRPWLAGWNEGFVTIMAHLRSGKAPMNDGTDEALARHDAWMLATWERTADAIRRNLPNHPITRGQPEAFDGYSSCTMLLSRLLYDTAKMNGQAEIAMSFVECAGWVIYMGGRFEAAHAILVLTGAAEDQPTEEDDAATAAYIEATLAQMMGDDPTTKH